MYADHGYLNDICSTTLNWSINGIPFGSSPNYGIAAIYILQIAPAAQHGLYVAVFPGKVNLFLNILPEFGIGFVIGVDKFPGFSPGKVGLIA